MNNTTTNEKIQHWATVGGVRLGLQPRQDSETIDAYYDAYLQKAEVDDSVEDSPEEQAFRKQFFLTHTATSAWVVNPPNNGDKLKKISVEVYV